MTNPKNPFLIPGTSWVMKDGFMHTNRETVIILENTKVKPPQTIIFSLDEAELIGSELFTFSANLRRSKHA